MWLFYDLIFFLISLIYFPIYLFRRKVHRGFFLRLGFLPKGLSLNNPIWIHAVSVGEVMAVRGILEELRKAFPDKRLFVTTVTATGNKIAKGMAEEGDFVTYLPLDFSFIVRGVIDKIRPFMFIVAETEIWPNLISHLHQKNIPIIVVNGRISDSSYRGYLGIKFLVKRILNKVDVFCVQTKTDAQRLAHLGVLQNKIQITGNMKFDLIDYADLKKDYTDYRLKLGLEPQERLLIAGSTHANEETVVLDSYRNLLRDYPKLKLLIAPRHPERVSQIEKMITKSGFSSTRISRLNPSTSKPANPQTVFILDTVGQLMNYYAIAEIVFVGGSLVKKGGHNILEPASLGKPILFGPHMFNFRDIADLFLEHEAGILVRNKEILGMHIRDLLNSPSRIIGLSQRAKELILQNKGATRRNMGHILKFKKGY